MGGAGCTAATSATTFAATTSTVSAGNDRKPNRCNKKNYPQKPNYIFHNKTPLKFLFVYKPV
jgi:hypothetical protein